MQALSLMLVFGFVFVQISANCKLPPSQWCSSRDAAKLCQVERQCEFSGYLPTVNSAAPVNLALYYESLCPGCREFFNTQLFKAYHAVGQIMNITLVPYGNALETKEGSEWKFQCQHGPEECVGNLIEVCTIYYQQKVEKYLPFIHCMEGGSKKPEQAAKKCATQFPVPLEKILACSNSSLGNRLEHAMALKTNALSPPHQYVPWITVNGVHTEKLQTAAETDLINLICDTYQGVKPPGCNKTSKEDRCWRY